MALSLFSGCGGDTLGMETSGIPVKYFSEIKSVFQKSHLMNFESSKLVGGDITKISNDEFKKLKGHVAVIFAGFPCQTFSHAGKKNPDDPRGQLFIEFARATEHVQPEFIIGENVKGLTKRNTKSGENFLEIIIQTFQSLGYFCQYKVFNCDRHGVPQKRERLIIVGSRNKPFRNPFDSTTVPVKPYKSLEDIISFSMKGALQVSKEVLDEAGVPDRAILTDMKNEETSDPRVHPYLTLMTEKDGVEYNGKRISRYSFSFGRRISPVHCEIVDVTKPSKTIICTYDHQPRMFVALRNKNGYFLRPYLIDELKEIQGFPRDYHLAGSEKEQIVQLGNAVPPPLIQCVCEWIFKD